MQRLLLLVTVLFIVIVASFTGMGYCWQKGITTAGPLIGFIFSFSILLAAIGIGVTLGMQRAFRNADDYARDMASAAIKTARETAEETVESLPETLIDGLERSVERARSRVFDRRRYVPPWRKALPRRSSDEVDDADSRPDDRRYSGRRERDEPDRSEEDKGEAYRRIFDDTMSDLRKKREQEPDN